MLELFTYVLVTPRDGAKIILFKTSQILNLNYNFHLFSVLLLCFQIYDLVKSKYALYDEDVGATKSIPVMRERSDASIASSASYMRVLDIIFVYKQVILKKKRSPYVPCYNIILKLTLRYCLMTTVLTLIYLSFNY